MHNYQRLTPGVLQRLSTCQGRSPQVRWTTTTLGNSILEVGRHSHGLYSRFTPDTKRIRFNMGDCRSTYKDCPFPSCQDYLSNQNLCRVIHFSHSMLAWSAQDHYLRQRTSICCPLLGTTTGITRNKAYS